MKFPRLMLGLASLVTTGSCVIIVNTPPPVPVPVGSELTCTNELDAPVAHLYFVSRIERSTVNLKEIYASIMTRTASALTAAGILPTTAVLIRSDERPVEKNGLLAAWGCNLDDPKKLLPEDVIRHFAQTPLDAGPIGCATDPLVSVGRNLTDLNTDYPPELPGRSGRSIFNLKPDIVLVVHFDERARRSALSDSVCSSAHTLATETDDELAPWLSYADGAMPADKIVHWFFTTDEGVERDVFISNCKQYEGFPTSVLDIIEPSANLMWQPLRGELSDGGQHVVDMPLCAAMTDHEMTPFFFSEIPRIAQIAGTTVDLEVLNAILGGMIPSEENVTPGPGQ